MSINLNVLRKKYENSSQSSGNLSNIRLKPIASSTAKLPMDKLRDNKLMNSKSQNVLNTQNNNISTFFLTQKNDKSKDVKKEIAVLEQLLAGATQTSQSTLLLKKRKEVKEVNDSLDLMKKEYKKRMDECEDRRLQFELKQAKLREQVLKFEKFIHENDMKRQRAEIKIKNEIKLCYEKDILLNQLKNELKTLEIEEQELKKELDKQRKYELYLEKIIEHGDYGYEEISDILNRYRTLSKSNEDVLISTSKNEKLLDELRHQLNSYKIERQNHILVSNSLIQDLQKQLEYLRNKNKENEEMKYHLLDKQKDISKEFSQITLSIKNIYNRCILNDNNNKTRLLMNNKINLDDNNNNNTMIGINKNTNKLNELNNICNKLETMLLLINDRMVDLIEITNEYKYGIINGNIITNSSTSIHSNEIKRHNSQSTVMSNSNSNKS